jgi:large-conductance mechanosensitive channel
MKKYITFGNFNTNYKFILFSIIFTLIYNFMFGVQIGYSTESIRFLPENEFRYHNLIHDIFNYFGIFIISLILLLVEEINSKTDKKNEKEVQETKSNREIILIHNPTKIDQINKNTFFNILLIAAL